MGKINITKQRVRYDSRVVREKNCTFTYENKLEGYIHPKITLINRKTIQTYGKKSIQ